MSGRATDRFDKRQGTSVINGNAVRKLQPVPGKQREETNQPSKSNNQIRRNRERALNMNAGSVLFLALAVFITLAGCIKYLTIQAEMTHRIQKISSLEAELTDLRSDNDETYNRIRSSVDLENIKNIAIGQLGMVFASPDQVIMFDSQESDYVRQYDDIPDVNK